MSGTLVCLNGANIYNSTDGFASTLATRELAYPPRIIANTQMKYFRYNGIIAIVVGDHNANSSSAFNGLLTTTDPTNPASWVIQRSHQFCSPLNTPKVIGWNGSYWLIYASHVANPVIMVATISKSDDGINWTTLDSNISSLNIKCGSFKHLIWSGDFWIAVLDNPGGTNGSLNCFVKSVDGITWEFVVSTILRQIYDIKYNGSYFLACGVNNGSPQSFIIKSQDCVTWEPISSSFSLYKVKNLAWNGSYWLASTYFANQNESIIKSNEEGTTWTVATNQFNCMDVAWDGVRWVAITGGDGFEWRSTDDTATSHWAKSTLQIFASSIYNIQPTIIPNIPSAPVIGIAYPYNASAIVSWNAPTSTSHPIVGYIVLSINKSLNTTKVSAVIPLSTTILGTTGSTSSTTISGLINGSIYVFKVIAKNNKGLSFHSAESNRVTLLGSPNTPIEVTAVPGDKSATISWKILSNGGFAISSYTIKAYEGNIERNTFSPTDLQTLTDINGVISYESPSLLTNGTSYTFTVLATNQEGDSLPSDKTIAVIPVGPPDAPTISSADAGNESATISWITPVSNGGSAISGYYVSYTSPGTSAATVSPLLTVGSTNILGTNGAVSSTTISDLNNGTLYTFTVVAKNSANFVSLSSSPTSVTPVAPPNAPVIQPAVPGNESATISWTAPTNTGGAAITGYTINSYLGISDIVNSSQTFTLSQISTTNGVISATFPSLTNGTSYTFKVLAQNQQGDSLLSVRSAAVIPVIPVGPPDAPTISLIAVGDRSATISWAAPTNTGGAAITKYCVTSNPGGFVVDNLSGSTLTATISGLTKATTYTFTVEATNSATFSSSVTSGSVIAVGPPDAPTGVIATAISGSATVNWEAPTNTGGAALTGYTIELYKGTEIVYSYDFLLTVSSELTYTLSSLTNGTSYTFKVIAKNSSNLESLPVESTPVTPATVPGKPTGVNGISRNGIVDVSWTAPNNGGAPITKYRVTSNPGSFTADVSGDTTTVAATNLTNGQAYTFTVVATNIKGDSDPSDQKTYITPVGASSSVQNIRGVPNDSSARITWDKPLSNGGSDITGYKVICVPDNNRINKCHADKNTINILGLKNGENTLLVVVALNGGDYQSDSVTLTTPAVG
jgi:hypothetical protein